MAKAEVEVVVEVEPTVSEDATATTSTGVEVDLRAGETIKIETVAGTSGKLVIPANLAEGEVLEDFEDPITGVKLKDNVLTVPVKDTDGETSTVIEAKVTTVVGTGTTAEAEVEEIVLKTAEQTVDLTADDPDVGTTSVSLDVDLSSIPDGASLSVKVTKEPDPEASTAFTLAARDAGTTVKDIAFTIKVTKVNLDPVVGEARITMKVFETWVNKYGASNVRIFRFSDTGEREVLETRIIGRDGDGNLIFEGISPNGLSVFSLIAVEAAPPVLVPQGGAIKAFAPGLDATLSSPDGSVSVVVLGSAPVGSGYLLYSPKTESDVAAAPSGLAIGSALFELTMLDLDGTEFSSQRFRTPINITITYTDDDLAAAEGNPNRIVLQKYDTSFNTWASLYTVVDQGSMSIQAEVTRLSDFALMGEAQPPAPTPTPTPTLEPGVPTYTPTTGPPTATIIPPPAGDVAPGSGLLMALLIAAGVLIAAGGYYLRQSNQS